MRSCPGALTIRLNGTISRRASPLSAFAGKRLSAMMQNGFVESFNGRMRDELLNETLFHGLRHVRSDIARWIADYNTERPYSALGYQTLRPLPPT